MTVAAPMRLSASTIRMWRRCPRRYFWRYVAGIEVEQTEEQQKGTSVHAVIEAHLKGKTIEADPHTRALAMPAMKLLAPRAKQLVEYNFETVVEGAVITGQIDYAYLDNGSVHVRDFKTTSDWSYAMSEEEAARDPQTVIYSHVATAFYRVPLASFAYIYLHKKYPQARIVPAAVTDNAPAWARLRTDAADLAKRARTLSNPRDWRANTSACRDYGECPFQRQCGKIGDGPMGFLAKITTSAHAPSASPATTPPPPPVETKSIEPARAPASNGPSTDVNVERVRLIDRLVAAGRDRADMQQRNIVELTILAKQLDDPINPPDGTPRNVPGALPQKEVAAALILPGTEIVVGKAKLDELKSFFAAKGNTTPERVEQARKAFGWQVAELREEATKVLGGAEGTLIKAAQDGVGEVTRKPRATKPTMVVTSETLGPPKTETLVEAGDVETVAPIASSPAFTTIFVNCAVLRGDRIPTLDELVAPIVKDVERAVGNDAFYGAIEYNKGNALVAAGLQKMIEDGDLVVPSELFVDLRERYAPDCLSVLKRVLPTSREIRGYV